MKVENCHINVYKCDPYIKYIFEYVTLFPVIKVPINFVSFIRTARLFSHIRKKYFFLNTVIRFELPILNSVSLTAYY